jgi:hypothetical protein
MYVDFMELPRKTAEAEFGYLDAAMPQPPLAIVSFHFLMPAWQDRNAISSAAFCVGAFTFAPQMT